MSATRLQTTQEERDDPLPWIGEAPVVIMTSLYRRLVQDANLAAEYERKCKILRSLLRDAVTRQRDPCDHYSIGKPGCGVCDPRVRVETDKESA